MSPARRVTAASTPRLSEVARHVVYPLDRIVESLWPDVEAQCSEFGDTFDPWQAGAGTIILGLDADGIYTATIGGVTLSIPRQVAKTFLVGRIIFALCVLFPGLKVIWTAHRTRTATNTFKSLQGYAKRKQVAAYIEHIRTANGEQEIAFTNGSVIMFGAREQGFGRGFDEVDVEVFDECQILTEKALEDMVAATNQSRHPHGALLFYMGTPPRPVDPGEVFTARRTEALSGESQDSVYIECSADPDADPDDRKQWAKANPSFPKRTPLRSMLRLRKNLVSDESWRREALGIWDDANASSLFPPADWAECLDEDSQIPDGAYLVFAVDVSWDRKVAHVAVAGIREDGLRHWQVVHRCDPQDVKAWLVSRVRRFSPLAVAVQGSGAPASSLIADLSSLGVPVQLVSGGDISKACGAAFDLIKAHGVRHVGDPDLEQAIGTAVSRSLGDGWAIDRKKSPTDVAGLVAVIEASWVLDQLVGSANYDLASSVH